MLGLIILIVILACVLAYVPLPQVPRILVTIALIIVCVVLLVDVLGGLPALGWHNRLLC